MEKTFFQISETHRTTTLYHFSQRAK